MSVCSLAWHSLRELRACSRCCTILLCKWLLYTRGELASCCGILPVSSIFQFRHPAMSRQRHLYSRTGASAEFVFQSDLGAVVDVISSVALNCSRDVYGVSRGKYTNGLELTSMAVCSDREDIYAISLTGTPLSACTSLLCALLTRIT